MEKLYTKVVGVTFEGRQELISHLVNSQELEANTRLIIKRDRCNRFDNNAVGVYTVNYQLLGFISKELAPQIAQDIDRGVRFEAYVIEATGGDAGLNFGLNICIEWEAKPASTQSKKDENNLKNGTVSHGLKIVQGELKGIGSCKETNIVIPNSVAIIANSAFDGCNTLLSIVIPDSVTRIDNCAFSNCTNLESVTILNGANSIGYKAFAGCVCLKRVEIPSSVQSIEDEAFNGCSSLDSITIPNSVIRIGQLVFDGTKYYNNPENWSNGVLYINNHLIEAKRDLASCRIKEGTKTISDCAFYGCRNLKKIELPNSIYAISNHTFCECSSLENITIPYGVTEIGDSAFRYCKKLSSVAIPSSVDRIGEWSFADCEALKKVTIPNNLTNIGDFAFYRCESLRDENGFIIVNGILFSYNGSSAAVIPTGVTSIGYEAFGGYDNHIKDSLISVTIPSSVTKIGDYAFEGCSKLASIVYEGTKQQWTNISKGYKWNWDCFSYSIKYKNEKVSKQDSVGLEIINGELKGLGTCEDADLVIPKGVTKIGKEAVCGGRVQSVIVPETVSIIEEEAFCGCKYLSNINIPNSVTNIGSKAFYGCNALADEKGFVIVNNILFSYNGGITAIIPNHVTSIGEDAFYYCLGLETVVIPEGVEDIGDGAFMHCEDLTTIVIPNSVAHIGSEAFYNCTNLSNIIFKGTRKEWIIIFREEDWDEECGWGTESGGYQVSFSNL